MPRRGAAAVVTMLLIAGCTGTTPEAQPTAEPSVSTSTAPTSAPSRVAASPSVASPSPTSDRIAVSATEVAGVPIGTPADDAEQRLTKALGRPVKEALPGCYGETGSSLTWGSLIAFVSDGAERGDVVLRGWVVTAGPNSQRIVLPYDTAVGQTTGEVMSRVPAAEGTDVMEGPYAESFLVTTPETPNLLWRANAEGGVVDVAAYKAEGCD